MVRGLARRLDCNGRRPGADVYRRGIVLLAICGGAAGSCLAQETPANIIAAHVRQQGYPCEAPRQAERNAQASRPNEAVWTLVCENATYRVTLVPDMAARIEVRK